MDAMDSDVMPSLPSEDFDLSSLSELDGGVLSEYFPQSNSKDHSFDLGGMAHPFSDAGTALSEMLQTETILNSQRCRTESASSSSSVLTSLLLPEKPPSMAHLTSPTLTHILQSDQVTSSTCHSPERYKSGVLKRTDLAQAADRAASIGSEILTITDILTGENPIVKSKTESMRSDTDTLSLLIDESKLFENGIVASDVGSLLDQFEEASATIPEEELKATIDLLPVTPTRPSTSGPRMLEPIKRAHSTSSMSQLERNSESEVVKLLKAKRAPTAQKRRPTQEVIEKIQSKPTANRKLAILLTDALPEKKSGRSSRSSTPVPPPAYASRKIQKLRDAKRAGGSGNNTPRSSPPPIPLALQKPPPPSKCSSGTDTPLSGSPLRIHLPEIDLDAFTPAASPHYHSSSAAASPAATPSKPAKKISISQYKTRLQLNDGSSNCSSRAGSPVDGRSCSVEKTMTRAAEVLRKQLTEVSTDYYDEIMDHDYCVNVPPPKDDHIIYADPNDLGSNEGLVMEAEPIIEEIVESMQTEAAEEQEPSAEVTSKEIVPAAPTDLVPNERVTGVLRLEDLEFGGPESMAEVRDAVAPTVLKSLLLDSNLTEECKAQAVKERAKSMRNMQTEADRKKPIMAQEEEDVDDKPRYQKFKNERKLNVKNHVHKKTKKPASKRKFRIQEASPPRSQFFDKLPPYFTDLPAPKQPGLPRPVSVSKMLAEQEHVLPMHDRDPSPERADPTYSKMPAYFSSFTNSTKYDSSHDSLPVMSGTICTDPLGLDCNDDDEDAALVIATSRGPSRAQSRSPSPPKYQRSRSVSRSRRCHRKRRKSYVSSSSSSSSSSSCSCSSSESSSRSRSRSRRRRRRRSRKSYRSRSPLPSRSRRRSRSRSRSRSYDRKRKTYHSKRRSRSRSPAMKQGNKAIEIEERRIVYVGRIPGHYTRRDLRQKFESFGEITDVSVHFREQGDNYGFVTFLYTCDAFACVEKGATVPGCETFDMCFGGRREFCRTNYADLDGNIEMEEEMGGGMWGRSSRQRAQKTKAASTLNFDDLLNQTMKSIRR